MGDFKMEVIAINQLIKQSIKVRETNVLACMKCIYERERTFLLKIN